MTDETRTPTEAALYDYKVVLAGVPLLAACLGISWPYVFLARGDGSDVFYLGPALALPGTVLGMVNLRARLRALTRGADLRTAPGGLLIVGALLVAAGALVPPMLAR